MFEWHAQQNIRVLDELPAAKVMLEDGDEKENNDKQKALEQDNGKQDVLTTDNGIAKPNSFFAAKSTSQVQLVPQAPLAPAIIAAPPVHKPSWSFFGMCAGGICGRGKLQDDLEDLDDSIVSKVA